MWPIVKFTDGTLYHAILQFHCCVECAPSANCFHMYLVILLLNFTATLFHLERVYCPLYGVLVVIIDTAVHLFSAFM